MNKLLIIGGLLALLGVSGVGADILRESGDLIVALAITLALQPWLSRQFE